MNIASLQGAYVRIDGVQKAGNVPYVAAWALIAAHEATDGVLHSEITQYVTPNGIASRSAVHRYTYCATGA